LEGSEMFLAVTAARATMEAGLEDQKTGLPPEIQVADHIDRVLVLVAGRLFVAALLAAARVGQGKLHLEAVPVARTLVAQQFHSWRQIQFDIYADHPWPPWLAMCFRGGRWQQGVSRGTSRCGNLAPRAYAANSNLPKLRSGATGKKTARL